ncbi:MAG: phenylalanine--tRNA ligase subunit beta [Gammaproteobacteria bacterium]|nr:phenylalanine--tRNA ligase subunit beta [Gammaproteobacteria bacterium]
MKVSEKWLREFVNPDVDTESLCEQLTNLGLEVDSHAPTYGQLTGVAVAEIVNVESLSDASKGELNVCTVNTGTEEARVVCAAPNVREGMRTAYARAGATLNERERVDDTRIHGVESAGMLCSGAEIGASAQTDTILELASDSELGADIRDMLSLDDTTIDIDLTPNRGDCLSLRGIAREIAVINGLEFNDRVVEQIPSVSDLALPIELANAQGCPRYLGRVIANIDPNATTPAWMVQRLIGCGLRPISPVVDVTNYVMLELGQPLHAFDLANTSNGIVVRDSKEDEKLTLLDGTEVVFNTPTLLITDGATPLAIAGVMGGERSGISDATKSVFLECAYFDPDSIIGVPRSYGIQTDASMRYERGVDPDLQYAAMERATQLLCEIVGGEPGPVTVAESTEDLPARRSIKLRKSRLALLIGESIPHTEVEDVFSRLGFNFEVAAEAWHVNVPSHRFDLSIEEDLVEEVCRVYGYNQIGSSQPSATLTFDDTLARESLYRIPRNRIAELGYYEVVNYSFIEKALNDRFVPDVTAPQVANPIASQYESMRKSLIPGLASAALHNLSRQQEVVRLFELGRCFSIRDGHISQDELIAGLALGYREPESWARARDELDFFDIKGDLDQLLASISPDVTYTRSSCGYLHPGQAADVLLAGKSIGAVGKLHPEISLAMDLPESTYVFEINAASFDELDARTVEYVAPFPYVRRDLALMLKKSVRVHDLVERTKHLLDDLLVDVTVFDVYEGENINVDMKSVGLGLLLQDRHTTLRDEVVASRIDTLVSSLSQEFGAIRR